MGDIGANPSWLPREVFPGVLVSNNAEELARLAARKFVDWAWQAIARDGQFLVALSGGSTPKALFEQLASDEFRLQIDWTRVQLFWGDERAVPPDDPESNYGMTRRELLIRVPIPAGNVHRMEAEDANLGRAAHEYENLLRQYLPLDASGFPVFHLIYLGIGPEGHTASLFPGSPLLKETLRWVSTPMVAKLGKRRMTLTLPVLDAAQRVVFLVSGAEKAPILREVLLGHPKEPLPAQMVQPRNGERLFLVDEAAAALLTGDAPAQTAARPPASSKGHS